MMEQATRRRKDSMPSIDNRSHNKNSHKNHRIETKVRTKNMGTKSVTVTDNMYFVNSQIASDKYVATATGPPTTNNNEINSQRPQSSVNVDNMVDDQKHLLPFNLIQDIRRKKRKQNALTTGSISSGDGRSCKSSSSGLISLGNTSFGFDFDECEGELGLPSSEEPLADPSEVDFNVGKITSETCAITNKDKNNSASSTGACRLTQHNLAVRNKNTSNDHSPTSSPSSQEEAQSGTISSLTSSNPSIASKKSSRHEVIKEEGQPPPSSTNEAASAAVERMAFVTEQHLKKARPPGTSPKQRSNNVVGRWNVTTKSLPSDKSSDLPYVWHVEKKKTRFVEGPFPTTAAIAATSPKTKQCYTKVEPSGNHSDKMDHNHNDIDTDDGYDTDVDGEAQKSQSKLGTSAPASSVQKKPKRKDCKREERNAREKERSFRISKKINELRSLLSNGGVIVPKGTKSSVLTEAVNYIKTLESYLDRSEM